MTQQIHNNEHDSRTDDDQQPSVSAPALTKFQVRMLAILAEERRYGLAVKRALEEYYGEAIHHGRLYPNLDELVQRGLVSKSEDDGRTNIYAITTDGLDALCDEIGWVLDKVGVPEAQRRNLHIDTDTDHGDL